MIRILVTAEQNPHSRVLVQDDDNIYVLSGCCGERFDPYHLVEGTSRTETWAKCKGCNTILAKNDAGWSSDLIGVSAFADYMPSGIGAWAKYWLGLEDFKMEVTL